MTRPQPIQFPLRQSGVSLITAIFLLLLFAALAAYMASLSGSANTTSAQDVGAQRAYYAAQAGIEWGAYQVTVPVAPACVASTVLPAPIDGFTVTVTCTVYGPYTESGGTFRLYRLVSTAVNSAALGTPGYAERQVVATVSR